MEPGDVVLGRFEVERFAGSGGMGDLYVGRDRQTRAPVALKTLHVERAEDRARFLREVKILSELRGPHVVRYVGHLRVLLSTDQGWAQRRKPPCWFWFVVTSSVWRYAFGSALLPGCC